MRCTQTFESHASNQQSISDDYNAETSQYPEIVFMMRGNYSMPTEATDHVLIRAEKEQWEGTKPGDKLTLKWNQFTTTSAGGVLPFNGDPVLNANFFNGQHIIVGKVKMVVEIVSALQPMLVTK